MEKCVQIIRGLPGSGKSTIARNFDCLHLEFDMFCTRGRRYIWNREADRVAHNLLDWAIRDYMREGIDLVIAGVLATTDGTLGHIIGYAHEFGYDVFIKTLPKLYKDVHGCSKEDLDRFAAEFQSDAIVQSNLFIDFESLTDWLIDHVHYNLMDYRALTIPVDQQKGSAK